VDTKPKPEPDDKEQSERFKETARQLETDESGEAFDRAFGVVTSTKNTGKKDAEKDSASNPSKK
jgi:hypothetical protein